MKCPVCGSENGDGLTVDIGVGFQRIGPWECFDCGWSEADQDDEWFDDPSDEDEYY